MIRSSKFTCVLDTCVLFPLHVRDLIFWFGYKDLFIPKWSQHIFDEWREVMKRRNISDEIINKQLENASNVFKDAFVKNYEGLIDNLTELNDVKDRHVLAAAIKTNANLIVTNNLKDFPNEYLETFGLQAKSADDFIADLIDLHNDEAVEAFRLMVVNKKNPPISELEMLDILRNNNLTNSANYLHTLI